MLANCKNITLKDDPVLECDWSVLLPVMNDDGEYNRIRRINPRINKSVYPLTRDFLNNYFNHYKFDLSKFEKAFYPDCASSMYSYFIMTYGYTPGTSGIYSDNKAIASTPGGQGISFGFNPFFGLFNIDSPILWIVLLIVGAITIKKVLD